MYFLRLPLKSCHQQLWTYNADSTGLQLERAYPTGEPVWRTRFTPLNKGFVSIARQRNFNADIWHPDGNGKVASFGGHSDVISEFVWRFPHEDGRPELVTWSKDRTIRLWPFNNDLIHVSITFDDYQRVWQILK